MAAMAFNKSCRVKIAYTNPQQCVFRCAGEVAAVAFNEYCGVGVAYNASIGGRKSYLKYIS